MHTIKNERFGRNLNYRHGLTKSRLHKIWDDCIQRCTNPNAVNFDRYGGRGVKICDEWRNDFRAFKAWADTQGYNDEAEMRKERKDRLTLDRVDSSGNYCPDNCRWATYKEQDNNKKNNIRLEYNGENKTLAEISEIVGVSYDRLYYRLIVRNLPLDEALSA